MDFQPGRAVFPISGPRAPTATACPVPTYLRLFSPQQPDFPSGQQFVASHLGKPQKLGLTCVPSLFVIGVAKAPRLQRAASFLCMIIDICGCEEIITSNGRAGSDWHHSGRQTVRAGRKRAASPHPEVQGAWDLDTYLEGSFVLCLSPTHTTRQGRCPSWLTQQALHSNHPTHG